MLFDDIVSQYAGTAQQVTDALNADVVQWSPVPISTLNALCDTLDVTLWLNGVYGSTTDANVKKHVAKALGLFSAKYTNLDLQDPEVRGKVEETLGVLAAVPGTALTPEVLDRIYGLGKRVVNVAKSVNNGELVTARQVQDALDRNARRQELVDWHNKALQKVATTLPVPTLADLLTAG